VLREAWRAILRPGGAAVRLPADRVASVDVAAWLSDSAVDMSQSTPAPACIGNGASTANLPVKIVGTPAVIFVFFLPIGTVVPSAVCDRDAADRARPSRPVLAPALALYVSLGQVTIPRRSCPPFARVYYA
jgi:hypothetical protein